MFEKLIDVILEFAKELAPWVVINQFSAGISLRLGLFHRELSPGFHWKIPFIDRTFDGTVVTSTHELPSQTLTTKDGKQIVVKAIVKYDIFDFKKFYLTIHDSKAAISDITQGIIKKTTSSMDWSQCNNNELDNILTRKTQVELRKWGINAEHVTLTNIGLIRSLRLFNEKDPEHKL